MQFFRKSNEGNGKIQFCHRLKKFKHIKNLIEKINKIETFKMEDY